MEKGPQGREQPARGDDKLPFPLALTAVVAVAAALAMKGTMKEREDPEPVQPALKKPAEEPAAPRPLQVDVGATEEPVIVTSPTISHK